VPTKQGQRESGDDHTSTEQPKQRGNLIMSKKATQGKPGTKALREIAKLQKSTNLLIPRAPFLRVVREIIYEVASENFRVTTMAVEALREAAESYLTGTFEDAYLLAIHAKRVTLFPRDIQLLVNLRRENDIRA